MRYPCFVKKVLTCTQDAKLDHMRYQIKQLSIKMLKQLRIAVFGTSWTLFWLYKMKNNIFFTNSYINIYYLGQFKPFFTPKRDTLDTPQIIPNVQCSVYCVQYIIVCIAQIRRLQMPTVDKRTKSSTPDLLWLLLCQWQLVIVLQC